jgi:GWxTD domain-containing protein
VALFCRVPYVLLDALAGSARVAAYRLTWRVREPGGSDVAHEARARFVSGDQLDAPGGAGVEQYEVVLPPGRYVAEANVVDSASGRTISSRLDVEIPARTTRTLSDLLLGTGLRVARGRDDTVPRRGEVRQGAVFVAGAPWPTLPERRPRLAYYLERYDRADAPAAAWVEDSAGGRRWTGTVPGTQGLLQLPALAPGGYRFALAVVVGSDTIVSAAGFDVASPDPSHVASAAPPAASDPFGGAIEEALDSLYGPLVFLMRDDERGQYGALTVDNKRAYLRRFWARRDPTPGTPRNEALEDFYARLATVNRLYREGGGRAAAIPGWRTDRGRIHLNYGPPDAVLSRPQPGSANPYEVWKYTRGRPRKFVFLDLTRFGTYALIWTNDVREVSRPDWRELLGREGVEDITRF